MKLLRLIVILILLLLIVYITFTNYLKNDYTETEQNLIDKHVSKEDQSILTDFKKINNLSELFEEKNYQKENFPIYMSVFNDYPTLKFSTIVLLGNYNLSNFYKQLIEDTNYQKDLINDYLTYKINNKNKTSSEVIHYINDVSPAIKLFEDENFYIADYLNRYISYYNNNSKLSYKEIIATVNSNADFDFYTETKKTDTSKGFLMLVNKYNYLSNDFIPENLVSIDSKHGRNGNIQSDVYEAYKQMASDISVLNLSIPIMSPYRSYQSQKTIYQNYVNKDGQAKADTYSARAGYSEHQTGLAIDIGFIEDSFAKTKEYEWLQNNAHKYGFIIRYPKDKEHLTGYQFEPWHYRYVGVEVATKIVELDITFDEYYAYFVK